MPPRRKPLGAEACRISAHMTAKASWQAASAADTVDRREFTHHVPQGRICLSARAADCHRDHGRPRMPMPRLLPRPRSRISVPVSWPCNVAGSSASGEARWIEPRGNPSQLGFNTALPEPERKKLSAMSRRIKNTVEHGGDHTMTASDGLASVVAAQCSTVILKSAEARKIWDDLRAQVETDMAELAKQLPAYEFVRGVRGVTEKTLAIIVGEAGNLSNYPETGPMRRGKGCLWKRLSIGCVDGVRQGNPGPNATAEDWTRHGYKKSQARRNLGLLGRCHATGAVARREKGR